MELMELIVCRAVPCHLHHRALRPLCCDHHHRLWPHRLKAFMVFVACVYYEPVVKALFPQDEWVDQVGDIRVASGRSGLMEVFG